MKTCFKCSVSQPISCFYKHSKMADGHLNKCIACTKRDVLVHRKKNVEAIRSYDRERSKLPHRIQISYQNAVAYRLKYPDRYRANSLVAAALKSGSLFKTPCGCCGSADTEAHHPDYSRPLDVIWLCAVHHKEIHLSYSEDHYHNVHEPKQPDAWRRHE